MISQKIKILTPLQKFLKNMGDLGKLFVAQRLKSDKSSYLVTLICSRAVKLKIRQIVPYPLTNLIL